MDRLLKMARDAADAAELLLIETNAAPFNIYTGVSNDIIEGEMCELSLRIIKDGRLGIAKGSFTGKNRDAFLQDALTSAETGPKVNFHFAPKAPPAGGSVYDGKLAGLTASDMASEGWRLFQLTQKKAPDMLLNLYMDRETKKYHLVNTAGADASYKQTSYTICLLHMFPGSKEGINKELVECKYFDFPEEKVDELVEEYNQTKVDVEVPTRRMPVLFRTSATWSLLYRILVGVSGDNWVRDLTPLKNKVEEQIFPEFVTIVDDPTLPWAPGSVPYDDEGVPTQKKTIVDHGVLKNFIFDLAMGAESGKGSTGNGFKKDMWSKGVEMPPVPRFTNLVMHPGTLDYREMIRSMEEGIVINDVIGFHAGNMMLGEFSMNVGIGSYIKNGKPIGRAIDTMVAGNIYEDFHNIRALGTRLEYNPQSYSPDILFGEMSVSGTA
ncbi:MAG: TldD/PmbA family protein [Planctomycetota bacterium]|jgi:PmbA protein